MTERIDHRKRAEGQIASIYGKRESPDIIQAVAVVAQAEATLALVEQQRIANIFTLQSGAVNGAFAKVGILPAPATNQPRRLGGTRRGTSDD